MNRYLWPILALAFAPITSAATVEKPIWTNFTDRPSEANPVLGYVQFGQLADGSPAILRISRFSARFYERQVLLAPSGVDDFYAVSEINCKTGMVQIIGMGSVEHITALLEPPPANPVMKGNRKNLAVYREICEAAELLPSW